MKTLLLSLIAITASMNVHADGFQCVDQNKILGIKLYNHTEPTAGTRNAAIMVLSDLRVQAGRKTIAKFEDADSLLKNSAAYYQANVDLRYSNSNRAGENILGTKLGYIDTITVAVDFSYSEPTADGEFTKGKIVVLKRNGSKIVQSLVCKRYLKN